MRQMTDNDAAFLRTVADLIQAWNVGIADSLRRIADPTRLEQQAQTRTALAQDQGNGTFRVWCDGCQKEHFMSADRLTGRQWKLPCGVILSPPEEIPT